MKKQTKTLIYITAITAVVSTIAGVVVDRMAERYWPTEKEENPGNLSCFGNMCCGPDCVEAPEELPWTPGT